MRKYLKEFQETIDFKDYSKHQESNETYHKAIERFINTYPRSKTNILRKKKFKQRQSKLVVSLNNLLIHPEL